MKKDEDMDGGKAWRTYSSIPVGVKGSWSTRSEIKVRSGDKGEDDGQQGQQAELGDQLG